MIGDVLTDLGRDTAEQIAKTGATASFTELDITDESSWEAAVTTTIEQLGGYDILINNAGVEVTALLVDLDPAELSRMLDVNVVGTALGIKHAFRAMAQPAAADRSSTSRRSRRPSHFPGSPGTRPRNRPSTD